MNSAISYLVFVLSFALEQVSRENCIRMLKVQFLVCKFRFVYSFFIIEGRSFVTGIFAESGRMWKNSGMLQAAVSVQEFRKLLKLSGLE